MSTRNIHVNIASYTLLVAGKKKYTGEEWDVLVRIFMKGDHSITSIEIG